VRDHVEVGEEGLANVLVVKATGDSAASAARLANVYAASAIDFRRGYDRHTVQRTINALRAHLVRMDERSTEEMTPVEERNLRVQRARIADSIRGLTIYKALQYDNLRLIEPAVPPDGRASSGTARLTLYGVFLGLVLGCALALVLGQIDKRDEVTDPARPPQPG
jgi:hypothetical protein